MTLKRKVCKNESTVKKINQNITVIFKLLKNIKYYVSGSSVMATHFMDKPVFDDIDLYFPNKLHLKNAKKIFIENNFKYSQTKYAYTFNVHGKKIQLIKRTYSTLNKLANAHDFANCCLAYEPNTSTLIVTDKANRAWKNSYLSLNKTPLLSKKFPPHLFLNQLIIFYYRCIKYKQRYNLSFDKNTKKMIKDILKIYKSKVISYNNNAIRFFDYSGNRYFVEDINTLHLLFYNTFKDLK